MTGQIITKSWQYDISVGFNEFYLNIPVQVEKGSIIIIDTLSSALTIDPKAENSYPDYKISGTDLEPLDILVNKRLYFSCIISNKFYDISMKIQYNFKNFGQYNLTAKFSGSNSGFLRKIDIPNSKKIYKYLLYIPQID